MTNLEAWNLLTSNLPSPQLCVDAGVLGLVSAALERRVWLGNGRPVYPNLYIALSGRPGCGKTLVLNEIKIILQSIRDKTKTIVEDREMRPGYFYNIGPDTITFEGMITDMCRKAKMVTIEGKQTTSTPYVLLLSELNSFIRLNNEQVPKAMLKYYDCEDYEYVTKHGPPDFVRKTALTVVGGCTMTFVEEGYKKGIFTDGFSARFVWIFASNKRRVSFEVDNMTEEQLAARAQLVGWTEKLSKITGQVTYSASTKDFLEHWMQHVHAPEEEIAPVHMQNYMGRRAIHLRKLAMCFHFLESDSLVISTEAFQRALAFLATIEPGLGAFRIVGKNPLAGIAREVFETIQKHGINGITYNEIMLHHMSDIQRREELTEILEIGKVTGQLTDKLIDGKVKYYAANR